MRRLAAPSLVALVLACALIAGVAPSPVARADATALAVVACENLAPYLDGDPGDETTPADEQSACLDPIPPTGELSIFALEQALGDGDGILTWEDLNPVDFLDHNRIDAGCTYDEVVVQAARPAPGCTLLVFVFVDDEAPGTIDVPSTLVTIESPAGDFTCDTEGDGLGQDDDCDDSVVNGDGVVVFRVLTNASATNGDTQTVEVHQEAVLQSSDINVSAETRFDPPALDDFDEDGIPNSSDNCVFIPNPDQRNTDSDPMVIVAGLPLDATQPNGDDFGDACDADDDNDGLFDFREQQQACFGRRTDPVNTDTDGDLVHDGAECRMESDPTDPDSRPRPPDVDSDGDGLDDTFENGMEFNRLDPDSDGDRIADGIEFMGYNTSPLHADTDFDGCPDGREIASVDGNTTVNILDVMIVIHGPSLAPSPQALDLNKDGAINVLDLLLIAANFAGTPCVQL